MSLSSSPIVLTVSEKVQLAKSYCNNKNQFFHRICGGYDGVVIPHTHIVDIPQYNLSHNGQNHSISQIWFHYDDNKTINNDDSYDKYDSNLLDCIKLIVSNIRTKLAPDTLFVTCDVVEWPRSATSNDEQTSPATTNSWYGYYYE